MTNGLNSNNNGFLGNIHDRLEQIKVDLDGAYQNCMNLTENQYPEVYYLRGIFNNLQAIVSEVDKGVQGGFVAQSYFDEKSDKLVRDLEGLVKVHRDNVSTHFSTKVVEFKE